MSLIEQKYTCLCGLWVISINLKNDIYQVEGKCLPIVLKPILDKYVFKIVQLCIKGRFIYSTIAG